MDNERLGRIVARVGGAGGLVSLLADFPGPERLSDFGSKQAVGVLAGLVLVAVGQLIQRRASGGAPAADAEPRSS